MMQQCRKSGRVLLDLVARPRKTIVFRRMSSTPSTEQEKVSVTWIHKDGTEALVSGEVGLNLMEIAHRHGIELEGACEGACACSTCHVILEKSVYKSLPEPSENEEDMLDQAFGLTSTSRLGCQVQLEKQYAGMRIKLPKATRNFYVVRSIVSLEFICCYL